MSDTSKACYILLILIFISVSCVSRVPTSHKSLTSFTKQYSHPIPYDPRHYVAYHVSAPIVIDGQLNDAAWGDIPWTEDFLDIEGDLRPIPTWQTKAKMCWTDSHFIIAALIEEPHIWATLTQRDAIMYYDDDFEVFIDPDADGHHYFEFEMNAYNAIWDLFMLYPYGIDDRRNYIMNWDIKGIETAVHVDGTVNDPSDLDKSWSVEIAIPWATFKDFKTGADKPQLGDQWRINFSRVDWTMEIINGEYAKEKDDDGKPLPEDNWVWSPTGYVNMHKPETWGYVQFESDRSQRFQDRPNEKIKWAMWQTYYTLKKCIQDQGTNCTLPDSKLIKVNIENYTFSPKLEIYNGGFLISAEASEGGFYTLDHRAQILYHKSE